MKLILILLSSFICMTTYADDAVTMSVIVPSFKQKEAVKKLFHHVDYEHTTQMQNSTQHITLNRQ